MRRMPLLCMYMCAREQRVWWIPLLCARWLGVWAELREGARWRLCACLTVCVSPGSVDLSHCLCFPWVSGSAILFSLAHSAQHISRPLALSLALRIPRRLILVVLLVVAS